MKCEDCRRRIAAMVKRGAVQTDRDLRDHLSSCRTCWDLFVGARWTISRNTRDYYELKAYLGTRFKDGCDSSWALAREWNSAPRTTPPAVSAFYANTPWYVYNLTIWAACGQRPRYVENAAAVLRRHRVKSILDFGAGVGTDALELASSGMSVVACDINRSCRAFLEWRAKRRDLRIAVIEAVSAPPEPFDALWVMDVIEHLPDPVATLSPLLNACRVFIFDTECSGESGGRHPFHYSHDLLRLQRHWRDLGFAPCPRCEEESGLHVLVNSSRPTGVT